MQPSSVPHFRYFAPIAVVLFVAIVAPPARAGVRLPAVISDHMVLQAEVPVPVWGWAEPGEKVTVTFAGQSKSTQAAADGKWNVALDALRSSDQPQTLTVQGKNTVVANDVLVGEVWLGSGQSNMAYKVASSNVAPQTLAEAKAQAAAARPAIRFFMTLSRGADDPQEDVAGRWTIADPETVGGCSAVAWYFGLALHEKLHRPVGLIVSAVGGTAVETWIPRKELDKTSAAPAIWQRHQDALAGYTKDKELQYERDDKAWQAANPTPELKLKNKRTRPKPLYTPTCHHVPVRLYNGKIAGLEPYALKGIIWFQGDGNGAHPEEYPELIQTLIRTWRTHWHAELPFYYVEVNNMHPPQTAPDEDKPLPRVREVQNGALTLPRTGVVSTIDLGIAADAHFPVKKPVGDRLANLALSEVYGLSLGEVHSPEFAGYQLEGDKVRVRLKYADGLRSRGGMVRGFAVQDAAGRWDWAEGTIEGNDVLLSSRAPGRPQALRYAWAENPIISLENGAGLPLRPFRTVVEAGKQEPGRASLGGATRGDIVVGAFEGKSWDGWQTTGDAFGATPFAPGDDGKFVGFAGTALAWSGRGGVGGTGTLLSAEFAIERPFLNYLIAGARDLPAVLGVELIVEGRVVRAGSASEAKDASRGLYWRTWEVRDLQGCQARIRVHDQSAVSAIVVDHFSQSDRAQGLPADASRLGHESHRPQYHYTSLTGWLNDANGLLFYQGHWHLFHQHRPVDGSGIVWAHATSRDLLHWQRMPIAIASGTDEACASGSGLVDWENASGLKRGDDAPILLFYTLMPPSGSDRKGTQCLAYSTDGLQTLRPFPDNPILRTAATRDRDPKVFFHKPTQSWIMALSLSRNNTDRDHATYGLFRSADLKTWELLQELGPGSWYWECPDMFEAIVAGDPAQTKWIFMKGSGDYIVGTFDGRRFVAETDPIRTHWGGSFYGAQTFSDAPHGRRIQFGWMSTGQAGPNSWPGMPFNQQMSFPRELSLRSTRDGVRLFREPIAEISQLYKSTIETQPRELPPGENALSGVHHELLDLDMEIALNEAQQIRLALRGEEITYDVPNQKLKVRDRALSLAPVDGKLVLRTLLDRTSIELFGNRGEVTHSLAFFPDPANRELSLQAVGGTARIQRLSVRELQSIWPAPPPASQAQH